MKLQQLLGQTRKCIDTFNMLQENDCIAVGLSGGKDSMALLYALKHLQRFYPKSFSLGAICIDLGFDNFNFQGIQDFCNQLDVPLYKTKTDIAAIVFQERKESNPCSLCSKMRKGTLYQTALDYNFNKVAFAHHKDDFIETMMLSLLFEGHFHSFSPITYLEQSNITLIRPFLYLTEAQIKGFCNKECIPSFKNPCPADGHTKREYVKHLITALNKEHPGTKDRLYSAILNHISSELHSF